MQPLMVCTVMKFVCCWLLFLFSAQCSGQCLSDPVLEGTFENIVGEGPLPLEGSCCQADICAIPCPQPVSAMKQPKTTCVTLMDWRKIPAPSKGFGVVVGVFIGLSFVIGLSTYFVVKGKSENFFVAGRSLPIWILAFTLGAQSVDVNSILSNSDLAYKYV